MAQEEYSRGSAVALSLECVSKGNTTEECVLYCHVIDWLLTGIDLVNGFTGHRNRNYK
jgi:hypothetical protein